jgi:hypothetical protein
MKKCILPIFLLLVSCSGERVCKKVLRVDGCGDDRCGVEFEDGSFGTAYYPIKGRMHCKSKESKLGTYFPLEED